MSRKAWLAIGFVAMVVCGRIALLGQDSNWDFRNYHYSGCGDPEQVRAIAELPAHAPVGDG